MATTDFKYAYYSVKIDDDTPFLKSLCNSKLLKFVVLPNGLPPGPRKLTKLTKPSLAMLRMQGYAVAIYINNIVAIDQSFEKRLDQEKQKNYEKCCIIPTKPKLTIREFPSFIGTLTSLFPRNQFGPLYYRAMLKFKDKSLKYNK